AAAVVNVARSLRPCARKPANGSAIRLTMQALDRSRTPHHGGHRGHWEASLFRTGLNLRVHRVHRGAYFAARHFSTVFTSLSPRPDKLTSRIAEGPIVFAIRVACATACADSSAGRMPSSFASAWNAS